MHKALYGPQGYKNGKPYDFESKDLLETANSMDRENDSSNKSGFIGMNVLSPGGLFDTGLGNSWSSTVVKELCEKHNKPDACATCGVGEAEAGKSLLLCSRCKDRKYFSPASQKKHWKIHKKLCEPATMSE